MTTEPRPKTFGIVGVTAAFFALLTVLVGPSVHAALYPQPSVEDRIADTAVKIRDRVAARLKGAPPPEKAPTFRLNSPQLPYIISLALAGTAIIGGCVSYLRREDHRYAHVACGVGILSLAWHAVLLALGALILCIIIFSVLGSLGSNESRPEGGGRHHDAIMLIRSPAHRNNVLTPHQIAQGVWLS